MVKSIDQTGQLPQVGGTEAKPDFKGSEVVRDEKAQSLHKGSSVSHKDQPIKERDVEVLNRAELTADQKIGKVLDIIDGLKRASEKPVDMAKAESDLKELQADFTLAYDVVNLMGDGEEIGKVKGFLENIISIIKSLLIFVGIMKEVDAKGNVPPEKQVEADKHLKAAEEGVLKLGDPPAKKPSAKAMPIQQGPALPAIRASHEEPSVFADKSFDEFDFKTLEEHVMDHGKAPEPAAEKPVRPNAAALLAGAGKLRKANVEIQDKPKAEESVLKGVMADRRNALEVEDYEPEEEFEDDFYVPEASKAPTPPAAQKMPTPPQEKVKRPMAAPSDLLAGIRKGRVLNKVEKENKPPVQDQKSTQGVFSGSKAFEKAQLAEAPVEDDDNDEWKD